MMTPICHQKYHGTEWKLKPEPLNQTHRYSSFIVMTGPLWSEHKLCVPQLFTTLH